MVKFPFHHYFQNGKSCHQFKISFRINSIQNLFASSMTENTDTKAYTKQQTKEYKKAQRQRVLYNWLFVDYPTVFSIEKPIPLDKTVKKELKKCLPENVSKADLKYALGWYTFRMNYLQALLEQTHRVNLQGESAIEITDEDRIEAQAQIEHSNELRKQYEQLEFIKAVNPFQEKRKCVLDDWLCQQYPLVFNCANPIPLAIGTGEELMQQLPETVSRADFKLVMSWYCRRTKYQKAILEHSHRINLQGELVGEVRENDRKLAQDRVNNVHRKQGKVIKPPLKTEPVIEIPAESTPKPIEVTEPMQLPEEIKSTKLVLKKRIVVSAGEVTPVKAESAPVKVTEGNIALAKGLK
jgi:sRNA-binding protein